MNATHQELFQELNDILKQYLSPDALPKIEQAYAFSLAHHEKQVRKSGRPYITHPLGVAIILAKLNQDATTIIAGLLHDTLEDTEATPEIILSTFGEDVLHLVQGVTKLGKVYFGTSIETQAENYRRLFLAMAEDLRVVVIKLTDRLHNMRTIKFLKIEKQERISKETLEIFAPLAHRLGIASLKWELEDLAFAVLEPEQFQIIKKMVAKKRDERESLIQEFIEDIETNLSTASIPGKISGRPKHFYSIYSKMKRSNTTYDDLFDILGVRIITTSVQHCYEILGNIHSLYTPLLGRIKDYIAVPKTNLYQSLHTTVIGPKGHPFEVQIRTHKMHQIAENGIAAHWQYKTPSSKKDYRGEFAWLRQILDSRQDEAGTFIQNLKYDLFEDEVFAFTPQGDIQALPRESTPIDFAYKIHTEVGHRCIGAKVNGHIVPLHYHIHNGDMIEILTSPTEGPRLGWLNITQTRQAKTKIKAWFRKANLDITIEKGKQELEKSLINAGYTLKSLLKAPDFSIFLDAHQLRSAEALYSSIVHNETPLSSVIHFLDRIHGKEDESSKHPIPPQPKMSVDQSNIGVLVQGQEGIHANLAKCCHPLPYDEITGFITLGHGVSVHRKQCPNMQSMPPAKRERIIQVEWKVESNQQRYGTLLHIETFDRPNIINDVMSALIDKQASIRELTSKVLKDSRNLIQIHIDCRDVHHLQEIKANLVKIPDVLSVYRPSTT